MCIWCLFLIYTFFHHCFIRIFNIGIYCTHIYKHGECWVPIVDDIVRRPHQSDQINLYASSIVKARDVWWKLRIGQLRNSMWICMRVKMCEIDWPATFFFLCNENEPIYISLLLYPDIISFSQKEKKISRDPRFTHKSYAVLNYY